MQIIKAITDHQNDIDKHPEKVKFLVQNKARGLEEILSYADIIEHLQRNNQDNEDIENQYLKFCNIIAHPRSSWSKGS
jgi:hypothetical protein